MQVDEGAKKMLFILISGGRNEMLANIDEERRTIRDITPGTRLQLIPDPMQYIIVPMIVAPREIGVFCGIDLLYCLDRFYDRAALPVYRPPMAFVDVIIEYGVRINHPDEMPPDSMRWIHTADDKGWNYLVQLLIE